MIVNCLLRRFKDVAASIRGGFALTSIAALGLCNLGGAQTLTVVSGADYKAPVAAQSIASAFGLNLATGIQQANQVPLPTDLAGSQVKVTDSSGTARFAGIFYVSPSQVNFEIPPSTATGAATVTITNASGGSSTGSVQISTTTPSFFTANSAGTGLASGNYLQVSASNKQSGGPLTQCSSGTCTGVPVILGGGNTTFLELYGTGIRGVSSLKSVTATVANTPVTVVFAGAAPGFVGLDQVNLKLPGALPASGQVNVVVTVNGVAANTVVVNIQVSTVNPGANFYISTNGNDTWSGTLAAPNGANTDGPFATFSRAQQAVQALLKSGPGGPIKVAVRNGTYYLSQPLSFGSADSGTSSVPVVWENYPGEAPVISGGVEIGNWRSAGGNLWQATLPASTKYFEQLFYNGQRRLRPRLGGYLGTYYRIASTVYLSGSAPPAAAPDPNCSVYVSGQGWECFDRFQYESSDPISDSWTNLGAPYPPGDIELLDFEQWSVPVLRIASIDTSSQIIYLTGPTLTSTLGHHGFLTQHRYLIQNLKNAFNQPGQWFLDRSTTPWILNYLANAGENPNTAKVIVPQSPQLIVATGLQWVTFQGLTLENDNFVIPASGFSAPRQDTSITAVLTCLNCQNVTLSGDTVTQTSGGGVEFYTSNPNSTNAHNTIENSSLFDLGAFGIRIGLLFDPTNTDANVAQFNTIGNNTVSAFGRSFPGSAAMVQGQGHDNLYTHNDVYDGYHSGIEICADNCPPGKSNSHGTFNNILSFNQVYNLGQGITSDVSCLYFNVSAGTTGNRVLNNKCHDVSDGSALDKDGYGGEGIYLDNVSPSIDVENNLVYRVSGSTVQVTYGPQNPGVPHIIKNNIFAYGRLGMFFMVSPYGMAATTCPLQPNQAFEASNNLLFFTGKNQKFQTQQGCMDFCGFQPSQIRGLRDNIYWQTTSGFSSEPNTFKIQTHNLNTLCSRSSSDYTFYNFEGWQQQGEDPSSAVESPGFVDPVYPADNYQLNSAPGAGFSIFNPSLAGVANMPGVPSVPPTFPTAPYNPISAF